MKRRIQVTTSVRIPFVKVDGLLRDDPGSLFGPTAAAPDGRRDHFCADVGAHAAAGMALTQEVEVVVGSVEPGAGQVTVPLWWVPRGHEQLLPSFDGALVASEGAQERTKLVLAGTYDVPLGLLGRFGDGLIGHRIARRSVTDFLLELARNLTREATPKAGAPRFMPPTYPEDLRGVHRSG